MKNILVRIADILEARSYRTSTVEVYAYTHLQTRLVINYHDCKEIFDFKMKGEQLEEFEESSFYTADHSKDEGRLYFNKFDRHFDRDVPEVKQEIKTA